MFNEGVLPVVLSERRTSVDTGNSRKSCLPGHGQQKCAAGACWPARTLGDGKTEQVTQSTCDAY